MSSNIQPGAGLAHTGSGLPIGDNTAEDFLSQSGVSPSSSKSRLSSLYKSIKKDISGPKDIRLQARIALLVVSIIAMLTFIAGFASCVIFGLPVLAVIPLVAGAVFVSSILLHRDLCSHRRTIPPVRSPAPITKKPSVPPPSSTPPKSTPPRVIPEKPSVKKTVEPARPSTPEIEKPLSPKTKTSSSWSSINLPANCVAKEAFCWVHKEIPNLKLISAKHSIDTLAIEKNFFTEPSIIINSANPTMYSGGAGTNKAISLKVTPRSWQSSVESSVLLASPPQSSLRVGEFRAGFWEPKVFNDTKLLTTPTLLGQLLGPQASDPLIKGDETVAFSSVEEAYANCVRACLQKGCHIIQFPLISSGIYSAGARDALAWQKMLRAAMLSGVTRAVKTHGTQKEVLIIVVDIGSSPLKPN
ncbi:macro domain-containing protein [Chlamydiifrater phoenicopteri]|uniref:macro domain-containing protein n=1 Tax=Chlamydiifrater phoenicopteri TaxID=2681469 RepID=UPI001BCD075F|nr:macro domain-containing protein [Chlamydiifrater phoenicopteri]